MIGQYLSNNNEKSYSAILQNFLKLNRPQITTKDTTVTFQLLFRSEHTRSRRASCRSCRQAPQIVAEPRGGRTRETGDGSTPDSFARELLVRPS
jgi:hypothetical protein